MITLTGQLICANAEEAQRVREHLALHCELSRAEPGCLLFSVQATADPLCWDVHEEFSDQQAFNAHQQRVAMSVWGKATAGIERRYSITETE